MFEKPFSFEGRVRRTEYGLSGIFVAVFYYGFAKPITDSKSTADSHQLIVIVLLIAELIALYFIFAQGTKRCHDIGKSGWYQLIPFYGFVLTFQDSKPGTNEYGKNPKGIQDPNQSKNALEEQNIEYSQYRIEIGEYESELKKLHSSVQNAKKKLFGAGIKQREEIVNIIDSLCENKEEALCLLYSYRKLFGKGLIRDLIELNSNGDIMAQNLSTFIDLDVIEPKYPYSRIPLTDPYAGSAL